MSERNTVEWLARLPELEPPEALWARIRDGGRQQRRGRLLAPAVAAAVAVIGLGLAFLVAPPQPSTPTAAPLAASVDGLIEDNRRLLEMLTLRQSEAGSLEGWQRQRIRSLELDLSLLDRKLQDGYSRVGTGAEMEALWRTRAVLLGSLIETYEQPRDIRRI
jgi:hypothetical protein